MRRVLWGLCLVALLGLAATFVVESGWASRVQRVQPVERDAKSETGWRLAGEPVELMDVPPDAFVTHGALGIPAQVDRAKLGDRVVPYAPLAFTIHAARLGSLGAALFTALGAILVAKIRFLVDPADV